MIINGDCVEELKKVRTLYADPPWRVDENRVKSSSYINLSNKYATMSLDEIKSLKSYVLSITEDKCHLYMWVTGNSLQFGLDVMKEWGFIYITNVVWVKSNGMGIGNYFRNFHEICLFGRKGVPKIDKHKVIKSVIVAPRRGHSRKPIEFYDLIEQRSEGPYLEMFARYPEPRPNWNYWGNEARIGE
jgi:N6-adenosine-specific RNA methylase IME4